MVHAAAGDGAVTAMRASCLSDWRGGWVDEGAPAPYAATAAAVRKEIIPTQADSQRQMCGAPRHRSWQWRWPQAAGIIKSQTILIKNCPETRKNKKSPNCLLPYWSLIENAKAESAGTNRRVLNGSLFQTQTHTQQKKQVFWGGAPAPPHNTCFFLFATGFGLK